MVVAVQPCRISSKGSYWSGALGCSNTLARRRFYSIVPIVFLTLSACAPKPLAVAVKPPPELLTCADEPVAPEVGDPGVERDRIVLGYVLAMRAAYGDCASKVAGIKIWADALP